MVKELSRRHKGHMSQTRGEEFRRRKGNETWEGARR
jgi:hypothetical protein